MKRMLILMAAVACLTSAFAHREAFAAEPTHPQRCPYCGGYHGSNVSHGYRQNGYGPGSYGLPQGRRYYNGRYFGNLNNRYYGPQYGYF
jgi:hypothetical protein